jgi:ferredoxin-NADP reductase
VARTAVQRRLTWLRARLLAHSPESPRVHRLVFDVPGWAGHLPGQHVDVRLTAEDGYTAQRSYSVASPPEVEELHLLVERLEDGEVSSYLTGVLSPQDEVELRGPIGGYFVWSAAADRADQDAGRRPVQLVGGGTGVSPFAAMLDHHARQGSPTPMQLLYSTRDESEILARDVLGPETTITLTRDVPTGWLGETGRIDRDMLLRCTLEPGDRPRVFVCGPTGLAESIATALVDLGHEPTSIRIERFGQSEEPS